MIEKIVREGGSLKDLFVAVLNKRLDVADDGKVYVDEIYVDNIKAAQEQLHELQGLSEAEKEQRTKKFNEALKETMKEYEHGMSDEELVEHNKPIRDMIKRMDNMGRLDDGDLWEAAEYVYEELHSLIKHQMPQTLRAKTTDEWFSDAIQAASNRLQIQIKTYENELFKVSEQNEILEKVPELLEKKYADF